MRRLAIVNLLITIGLSQVGIAACPEPLSLSLSDAILLALRQNPHIAVAQLNEIAAKYAVHIQEWQFRPHYTVNAMYGVSTVTTGQHSTDTTTVSALQPTATWALPLGTQATLGISHDFKSTHVPDLSLQIVQPLLRGFGRPIVEAALYNARDSEKISHLNVENSLRATVTAVINAYLQVLFAQNTLAVDLKALQRAERAIKQTQLFIQAGRKAKSDLVIVQTEVANAQSRLENDKNSLQQAQYALLTTIGVSPDTRLRLAHLPLATLINKYRLPTVAQARARLLAHDIAYQTELIMLRGTLQRAVVMANDNTRWQLDAVFDNSLARQGQEKDTHLWRNSNRSHSVMLTLSIPLDEQVAKQGVAYAKIALQQATLLLKQEKWDKEIAAINSWNTIGSAKRALFFAENAEQLQEKTYQLSLKKYAHGLIDGLELQSVQQQLMLTQQSVVNTQIAYLGALVNFDNLMGNTLKTWAIHSA